MRCAYFGEPTGNKSASGAPIHQCLLHGQCLARAGDEGYARCSRCRDRLSLADAEFVRKWQDPLNIYDRGRNRTDCLRGMLAGGSAFLACGGPSANDLPLEQLGRRGVWTMAVNNMAGHARFRPQAFVCSDPPQKFSHSIWLDPGIMKFVPLPKMSGGRAKLRKKTDGQFGDLGRTVTDCPNVWGFLRHSHLWPDHRFFAADGACWGNHRVGSEKTGQKRTVCTMLLALRIMYHLGARRIFLLGVDFRMGPGYGYSFNQDRDADAIAANNAQFAVVSELLETMRANGTFAKFGLEIYNCFERSGLRAFPYVAFDDALADCKGIVEDVPDLADFYSK